MFPHDMEFFKTLKLAPQCYEDDSRLSLAEMRNEASDTGKDTRGGEILGQAHNRGNVRGCHVASIDPRAKSPADVPDHTIPMGQLEWTRPALELRTELMAGHRSPGEGYRRRWPDRRRGVAGWTPATVPRGWRRQGVRSIDPQAADSDSDGLSDRDEKDRQTDPPPPQHQSPVRRQDETRRRDQATRRPNSLYTVTTREEEKEPAGLVLEQSPRAGT